MFNSFQFLALVFLSALSIITGCTSGNKKDVPDVPGIQRPNIVLILADDMGIPQLGCYGSNYYQTPNIDNLAKNGERFTKAYASAAVCSPTRAALMTGKYPARLHITDFLPGNPDTTKLLLEPGWQKYLPLEETTVAEVLKQSGYATAIFGKWHLSLTKEPPLSLPQNPDKQGFDDFFITYKPSPGLPLGSWQVAENDAHNVDTITSRAIDFIGRNKEDPFFLLVSHNSIHDPIMESEDLILKYEDLPGANEPANNPVWGAMVETLDKNVGRIVEKIEKEGLSEKTIIIFYSDNGAKHSYADQAPLRTGKGWLYEGGIRVPLIASWPGIIPKGAENDEIIASIDFFDTFLEIAGIQDSTGNRDGISFFPLLKEPTSQLERNTMYWHYPHYHAGSGMKPASAIRDGDYKLIEWYEEELSGKEGALELFNLKTDPGESNNLINLEKQKSEELLKKLESWKLKTGAQEPELGIF